MHSSSFLFLDGFLLYLLWELVANGLVFTLFRISYPNKQADDKGNEIINKQDWQPIVKGIVERFCMIIGLLLGYPQILVAFGALKIGTKLDSKRKIDNEYYLIGNMISLILVFGFMYLIRNLGGPIQFFNTMFY